MELLSEVYFSSCLVCLPKLSGGGELGQKSRRICYAVKQGEEGLVGKIAAHIGHRRSEAAVRCLLGEDTALVPMPGAHHFTQAICGRRTCSPRRLSPIA